MTMLKATLTGSQPFLEYLDRFVAGLGRLRLDELTVEAGGAEHVAVVCVDLIRGFAVHGPLSGPRVAAIVPPIRRLIEEAHALGVRHFAFPQDAHPADSPEFASFPPHCVAGSDESRMVDELASLPFASEFAVFPKTSVDSACGTGLEAWLASRPDLRRIVVVGDCTDLCVYQLAMYLQVRATVARYPYEVIVPADCVDTYDLPVAVAEEIGAMPHDGDLLHRVFLHQMALNGIRVVRTVAAEVA